MTGVLLGGGLAGLALGLLGAGGTIIGLPLFLYLGGPQGHAAFGTNAFGVTLIALALLVRRLRRGEADPRIGLVFALPGLAGIVLGTRLGLLYPASRLVFLLSFLILVVAGWIAWLGLRGGGGERQGPAALSGRVVMRVMPVAVAVGTISGFFAIGGGFLVVPGLAIAAGVDLRHSARASLLPIAAFAGLDAIAYALAGDVRYGAGMAMAGAGLIGGGAGLLLAERLKLRTVQLAFAAFLALVAAYMIWQNLRGGG